MMSFLNEKIVYIYLNGSITLPKFIVLPFFLFSRTRVHIAMKNIS